MKFLLKLYLIMFANKIGTDSYKNVYYELKSKKYNKIRRFVLYKGKNEASKVPPEWDGWLRLSTKFPIEEANNSPYLPNLTGTIYEYTYTRNLNTKKVKSHSSWEGK